MNKSESIKNIAIAMSNFQGEVKNPPKLAKNPFFNSKYTTLDALIDTAKPLLQKNGLSFTQSCAGDGMNITVTTLLMHSSGEWIESEPLTLKADKATAQGAGSAITYARRYCLSAFLGLASDEDDDGNNAEQQKNKEPKQYQEPKRNTKQTAKQEPQREEPRLVQQEDTKGDKVISTAQAKRLFALAHGNVELVKTVCEAYEYKSSKDILVKDYEEMADQIEKTQKSIEDEEANK